ncbi:MAG: phytanoyl-CoA dioxygenase family protein [Actinomycetota bacterium]
MLTDAQRATWRAQGWLHIPAALAVDAVADLDSWIREVEGWSTTDGPGMHHFEQTETGPAIARSEDFDPHHESLSAFLRTGLLIDVLAELFGEPAVLFKEKINYKQPGGAGFAPHQDATAYRFVDHHISVMVPLDPATVESGCLFFAPIEPEAIANTEGRMAPAWVEAAEWTAAPVEPGDLVFFDSYTPHHSGTNNSDRSRRVMYLTYNAAARGDVRQRYYDDKKALLAEAGDGERVRISVNDDFLGVPVEA